MIRIQGNQNNHLQSPTCRQRTIILEDDSGLFGFFLVFANAGVSRVFGIFSIDVNCFKPVLTRVSKATQPLFLGHSADVIDERSCRAWARHHTRQKDITLTLSPFLLVTILLRPTARQSLRNTNILCSENPRHFRIAMKFQFLVALPAATLFFLNEEGVSAFSALSSSITSRSSAAMSTSKHSFSFLGAAHSRNLSASVTSRKSESKKNSLSMVIDRMSNECVAGIQVAHDIGNSIGLKTLRNEVLFCGMIAKPERAAKTLQRYRLDNLPEIESAAIRTLQFKLPSGELNLKGENKKDEKKEALPFSEESRSILNKACDIADRMESETVRSEHVILALMGYNNGNAIQTVPVLDLLGDIPTLKQGNRETSGFRVTQFCQDLVNDLPNTPVSGDEVTVRDRVIVGGGTGGGTSTLNDVGVDMTQMALEGKLDMVFGRDKEIRSALRTLGRRRKNNPYVFT